MSTVEAYGLGLALAGAASLVWGGRGLVLTAAVMAVEWAVANAAVHVIGVYDPALAFGAVHGLAAWCLLRDERASAEVVIGGVYLVLFILDGAYLAATYLHGVADTMRYLTWLAGGGWAQIAVLAAGSFANGPGRYIATRWRRNPFAMVYGWIIALAAIAAGVAQAGPWS